MEDVRTLHSVNYGLRGLTALSCAFLSLLFFFFLSFFLLTFLLVDFFLLIFPFSFSFAIACQSVNVEKSVLIVSGSVFVLR